MKNLRLSPVKAAMQPTSTVTFHTIASPLSESNVNLTDELLTNRYRGLFPRGTKLPGREADYSPPRSAELENGGAIPPLPHMSSLSTRTTLPLLTLHLRILTNVKATKVQHALLKPLSHRDRYSSTHGGEVSMHGAKCA
jgi:hypothetical protein